jgi:hypothetical protein
LIEQEADEGGDLLHYIMKDVKKDTWIDAHPRHAGSDSWIAGRINEPATKTSANMLLVNERNGPVMVAVRKIKKGEELTVKYAEQGKYGRTYKVGRLAKRPSWL